MDCRNCGKELETVEITMGAPPGTKVGDVIEYTLIQPGVSEELIVAQDVVNCLYGNNHKEDLE